MVCMGQSTSGSFIPASGLSAQTAEYSQSRPRNIPTDLVSAVSNDTLAHAQIKHAIEHPELLMVSDWYHNTSEELRDIAMSANIDPM
jgi:hypothetical protein